MQFKPSQCPTCGGALQLPDDRRNVNCMYCGATVVVQEAIQAAAAATVPNLLKLARAAAESSNYTEAYGYFTRVLELDGSNIHAWIGKAEAAGRLSGQHSFRMPEMITYFRNAIEVAADEQKQTIQQTAANGICQIVTDDHLKMREGLSPKFWDGSTWRFYLGRVRDSIGVLEEAIKFIPNNRILFQTLIWFCDHNHGCIYYQNNFNGKRTRRDFDGEWNTWIKNKKAEVTEDLYTADPSLRPATPDATVSSGMQMTGNPTVFVLAAFALLVVVFIVIAISLNQSDSRTANSHQPVQSNTSSNSGLSSTDQDKRYLSASLSYLQTFHTESTSLAQTLAGASDGTSNLNDIRKALLQHRSNVDRAWIESQRTSVPSSPKLREIDRRLRRLHEQQAAAIAEILSYWKDSSLSHIVDGNEMFKKALLECDVIIKELNRTLESYKS